MQPQDWDLGVGNDGRYDPTATVEKRQEFSRSMGELAEAFHASGGDPEAIPANLGTYVGRLAEQEDRFGRRRLARSISLATAQEALSIRYFKQAAREYLSDKITPTGYALKQTAPDLPRSVCLLLSDLHLGANLSDLDNPIPFGAVQEARRLEFVMDQACSYKPHYRSQSELVLFLGGDVIDGNLGHDLRDGCPLIEQKLIFWRHFRVMLGIFAQQFPRVRVHCQPGNHGRDKVRHPGRATSSKWDGHEFEIYYALEQMCSSLPNVVFDIPFRAASLVDLQGSTVLFSHGDTEVKLGDPDTQAEKNARVLDRVNASEIFGGRFVAAIFCHFHKPRFKPGNPAVIFNGMLIPPNGHARAEGYIGETCGQWLWEAVPGFPIGDLRYIAVGAAQDRDERLGLILKPFRLR